MQVRIVPETDREESFTQGLKVLSAVAIDTQTDRTTLFFDKDYAHWLAKQSQENIAKSLSNMAVSVANTFAVNISKISHHNSEQIMADVSKTLPVSIRNVSDPITHDPNS